MSLHELCQRNPTLHRVAHERAYELVRLAERHPPLHQPFDEINSSYLWSRSGFTHPLDDELHR
jgi:hypothetical protein